ncbi:MAG: trypsin-like serine protease [Myxococcales bacterium]|nr:trypsin-like serine protease [Myxococcales bacterium]
MATRDLLGMAALCLSAMACAPLDEAAPLEDNSAAEIVNGSEADDLPWACTLSTGRSICSGTLIASNILLTAGHCVDGPGPWVVRCPYSTDTASVRASAAAYAPNYPNRDDPGRETINNTLGSDLGLVRLDRALREHRVARLDFSALSTGRTVHAVGRINNGTATNALFRSASFALTSHDRRNGFYASVDRTVIQAGDSGGGLFDARTGAVAGVNSAGVDAAFCRRGMACDSWAALAPAQRWVTDTLAQMGATTVAAPAPSAPPAGASDPCAAARDCGACTRLPTCGWCDGQCRTGSRSGPTGAVCGLSPWAWVSTQCSAR